jgi:hypothetical protein
MNIVSATITGSLILNGVNISSITGSEASINALNLFTASAATTGSNQFNGNQTVTGSVNITGSLIVTGSIIGTVTTASYVLNAVSASYAANADLLDGRDSLTFANTGSNAFVGQQNINGSVAITGSLTTTGAITAQTLNVQQVTSSIVYSSGSNVFGNSVSNTQSMTGSVGISGSLAVVGALTGTTAAFTGKVTTTSNIGIGTTNPDIVGYGAGGILGINSTTSDASSIQIGMVGTSGATSGTLADINFFGKNETSLVITRSLIRSGLDGAINSNFISFHTQNAGSLAEKMRITKGGNLEIGYGATQGLYKLDVNGTGRFADALTGTSATFTGASGAHIGVTSTITDATGSSRFRATATGGNIVDMTVYSASHASRANQAWIGGDGSTTTTVLQSAGVEFLRGTSAGATTLAGALTGTSATFTGTLIQQNITDGTNLIGLNTSNSVRQFNLFSTTTYSSFGTVTNNPLLISTNDTERMRITSGGFLKASNDGTYVSSTGTYHELRTSVTNNNIAYLSNTSASPYGPYIGFTTASPNNSTNYFLRCQDSTAERATIMSNGGLHNYSANDVNLSDETVKKDIFLMESQWEIFKNIEFSKFKYKDQTHDDYNYGVIAQQVLKVAPHFVNQDGFGNNKDLLSVYDSDIHYSSHKALQEALIRIEILENKIIQLTNK